ncbi:MAG TPA: NnrS family protein [Methylococcaceae bacterium]|nr:NnrS family protein [Methylococcaceae bacterium]
MMMTNALLKTLFSYAFRPFFLLTAGYAVLMIAGWGLHQGGVLAWSDSLPAHVRHGHEMLFGYAGGAIAGFLLTAVATWTNRPAISGPALIGLCVIWIIARLAAFIPHDSGLVLWGVASIVFWAGLSALMTREVIAVHNTRNYKVLALLLAIMATEAEFFGSVPDDLALLETCLRTGLFLVIGMISLIGGRIIPAFTQNWLKLNRPQIATQLPAFGRFDLASVVITTAFAVGFIVWPTFRLTGWLGILAAGAQCLRLARWRGWLAWQEPLLWVLHVGYAWIPIGFGLLGVSILGTPSLFDAGIHALTYGAIGTLILGVAARVALGHTGRALQAFASMKIAFGLMTLGTLLRLLAPLGNGFITASILTWMGSYLIFLVQYTPILLAPRIRS